MPARRVSALAALCAAALALDGHARDDKRKVTHAPDPPVAKLTLAVNTDEVGVTSTDAEYARGRTTVSCAVRHEHKTPQRDDYSGDLHAIYLVAAGKPHPAPRTLCDADALLKALRALPATVTQQKPTDKEKKAAPVVGAPTVTRYEVRFGKDAPKPAK